MRYFMLVAGAIVVALTFGLAACGPEAGGGAQKFTVTGTDFKFDAAKITVKANQPVEVKFTNKGAAPHNWTVEGLDGAASPNVSAGQSADVKFTPTKAGTYKVLCTVPGHAEAGMTGELVVQ